ncbi:hypothetical protein PR048_000551 [Dryococelus australis]|uniref:PiggyBac transposable element-derived protein domain-containing protein n=1 Tax=Dryococelus australis TaxID=614101 RepID=A0ABQ9IF00_9NEOP|nr:hypothetical protein PR048_000551 [Dryococelus australis]
MSHFQVYTGRVTDTAEKKSAASVVKELIENMQGKTIRGFLIIISPHCCFSNICCNIKFMLVGQYVKDVRCSQDGIDALQWKDKKSILFLFNYYDIDDVSTVGRQNKDGSLMQIPCPQIVKDYNANSGHVDKADMLKSLYEIDRKAKKWWLHIKCSTSSISEINSISLKEFRLAVTAVLIRASESSSQSTKAFSFKPYVPIERHFDKVVRGTSRRCALCVRQHNPIEQNGSVKIVVLDFA